MKIVEIFHSIQGEGKLVGVPSVFIRLAGCPLRCRWCDTKYAWHESAGTEYSIEEIAEAVEKLDCDHIVITGGEPMINPAIKELSVKLKTLGRHITIETAGIAFAANLSCDLMSISPKLANSVPAETALAEIHKKMPLDTAVLNEFIDNYDYQLKFVVDELKDTDEIAQCLQQLKNVNPWKVFLMPQAIGQAEYIEKSRMVAEICKRTGFTLGQRLQILLYNNERGK